MKHRIRFTKHALFQLARRGAMTLEVISAISESEWEEAKSGRKQCRKNFIYNQIWNGKKYAKKQVCPVWTEEKNEIVVITVYVYYF